MREFPTLVSHKDNPNKAIFEEALKYAESDINLSSMSETEKMTAMVGEMRGYVAGFIRASSIIEDSEKLKGTRKGFEKLKDSCRGWDAY